MNKIVRSSGLFKKKTKVTCHWKAMGLCL